MAQELMSLPCLVLGGGAGTRMRPATDSVPKPLLRIGREPFVVHQLRWLAAQGVTDVVYSIGYLGHMIRHALSARDDLGCTVRFVDEGDTRLGTGGAVRLAVDHDALTSPFFVLYGDSYLLLDLATVAADFERREPEALMTVFRNDGRWDTSNTVFDRGWVVRYDKDEPDPAAAGMRHIDYGLSILRCDSVSARIPTGRRSDLAEFFRTMSAEGGLAGYEVHDRFFEIGSPRGLAELVEHLGAGPR
jgi:NDP-sugar pyrophosphorylase family protein